MCTRWVPQECPVEERFLTTVHKKEMICFLILLLLMRRKYPTSIHIQNNQSSNDFHFTEKVKTISVQKSKSYRYPKDEKGVSHVDLMKRGTIMTPEVYCEVLNDAETVIWFNPLPSHHTFSRRCQIQGKKIFSLATFDLPPYSPDLELTH